MDELNTWIATLHHADPRRALSFAYHACREAMARWERMWADDPRPQQTLAVIGAWLDGTGSQGSVVEAAEVMAKPASFTWPEAAVALGDAVRLLAGAAATGDLEKTQGAVERAVWTLDRDWRWRWGTTEQLRRWLRRTFEVGPVVAGDLPRWRIEKEESTGGDLFEIEYRRTFWVVDQWTGQTVIYLRGVTSGRLISGSWGDLSSSGGEGVHIDGDDAVLDLGGSPRRVDLRVITSPMELGG